MNGGKKNNLGTFQNPVKNQNHQNAAMTNTNMIGGQSASAPNCQLNQKFEVEK